MNGRPERWWYGSDVAARALRTAVLPGAAVFGAGVWARNALYDRGVLRVRRGPVPVISVGNLTVGGTGKTPLVADLAGRLRQLGARPAIVLRGYGADEAHLHARLNAGVAVITDADRVRGIAAAAAAGATVVVLDDGFQHRRAARDLDIVIVSTEQWCCGQALLPRGPGRERPSALRRAGLVVVSRRAATERDARGVEREVRAIAPAVPIASVQLAPDMLVPAVAGPPQSVSVLAGRRVLAIAGVGDPESFFAQLRAVGAVVTPRSFPDHHPYTDGEIATLAAAGASYDCVVTTGKDAVKVAPRWPAKALALWYVSLAVTWSSGGVLLDRELAQLLSHRSATSDRHGH